MNKNEIGNSIGNWLASTKRMQFSVIKNEWAYIKETMLNVDDEIVSRVIQIWIHSPNMKLDEAIAQIIDEMDQPIF